MINTSDEKSRGKTARDTEARTKRRADQAQIVGGLQAILEADEQLLGFTRGLIAGGLRGKLTVGFEALFAPYVNIGLTERRIVLQHIQPESGKPNDILPHSFPLTELHSVAFSDIETFGGEPAGRLNLRLFNDQHFRLRFRGEEYVNNARTVADVFSSLTATRPKGRTTPTQSICPHCDQVLDRVSRFCPYCGQSLESEPAIPGDADATAAAEDAQEHAAQHRENEVSAPEQPQADADESTLTGSTTSDEMNEHAPDAPEAPVVETVAEQPPTDMTTEGHEAPATDEEFKTFGSEGDRPL